MTEAIAMTEAQLCIDCWEKNHAAVHAAAIARGPSKTGIPLCLYHWSVRERKWRRLNQQKNYTVEPIPASKG